MFDVAWWMLCSVYVAVLVLGILMSAESAAQLLGPAGKPAAPARAAEEDGA